MTLYTVAPVDAEITVIRALHELGCEAENVLPVHNLLDDLGIDSTELVELGMIVRQDCGLTARIDLRGAVTVADLVEEVQLLMATR